MYISLDSSQVSIKLLRFETLRSNSHPTRVPHDEIHYWLYQWFFIVRNTKFKIWSSMEKCSNLIQTFLLIYVDVYMTHL